MFVQEQQDTSRSILSPAFLPTEQPREEDETSLRLRALRTWLEAIDSFLDARNLPLTPAERAGLLRRNFREELLILREALGKCVETVAGLRRVGELGARSDALKNDLQGDFVGGSGGREGVADTGAYLLLSERLADAFNLCDALAGCRELNFHQWRSVGKCLSRFLGGMGVPPAAIQPAGDETRLKKFLARVRENPLTVEMGPEPVEIMSSMAQLLEHLAVVREELVCDRPLKHLLPVFALVRKESGSLLERTTCPESPRGAAEATFYDLWEGTAYALRMELRKAFEHELAGLHESRGPSHIYARIENAHGLLLNCLQQSLVALAQLFEPGLSGRSIFADFQTRLEQSLSLRRDLWELLRMVREANGGSELPDAARIRDGLMAFRGGSLRFLMFKDWETCERFAEEVVEARGAAALRHALHKFEAYLETLFSQVNMRAVLAEHPFEPGS